MREAEALLSRLPVQQMGQAGTISGILYAKDYPAFDSSSSCTLADGKPFLISRRYSLSLHEKSSLRRDLESWRGRAFTQEELRGFDLEVLIGVGCLVSVVHEQRN